MQTPLIPPRVSFFLPSFVCATLLVANASAQAQRPTPIPPQHADIKTSWTAPPKAPLTPEEAAAAAHREPEWSEPKSELPPALHGITAQRAHDELHFDQPGDGSLWVMGTTFKARFDRDGTTYVPFFGSDAPQNFPITFRAPDLAVAGVPVAESSAPVDAERMGDSVEYFRPALVERYELALASMEQLFVLDTPLGVGEASFFVAVETELEAISTPSGGLRFENEYGHVDYSRAIAIDADGDRLELPTNWTGEGIDIRVPAEFLASAAYPVIIDPVLTTFTLNNSDQVSYNPDVAYDATNARYLIVWEIIFSAGDHDVWGETRLATGGFLGGRYIDETSDNWAGPHVANNNRANQFLAVAQEGAPGSRIVSGRLWNAATNGVSSQFRIDHGETGESVNVDVGGDPALADPSYYCVVWERRSIENVDHDIHARLVSTNGSSVGSIIPIDNTTDTLDALPRISNSNGRGEFDTQNWNIVWMRQFSPDDWDIRGAQVHWNGNVTTPSFSIDFSGLNDELPVASSPLDDDGGGSRTWMVAYARPNQGPGIIRGAILDGGIVDTHYDLQELEGTHQSQRKKYPDIDSDGRSFMLIYSEYFSTSTIDLDIYASTFFWNGTTLVASEAHQNMAFSGTHEYDPVLCAAYGSGGPRRETVGVWTDFDSLNSEYDVEGGTYLAGAAPLGQSGCTSVANSSGAASQITASGSPFISDQNITLTATQNPSNVVGLFFFGTASLQVPFGDGYRCVGGFIQRMYRIASTDSSGTAQRAVDWTKGYANSIVPGPLYFQYWFRDTAAGNSGFNLSNAFHATFLP